MNECTLNATIEKYLSSQTQKLSEIFGAMNQLILNLKRNEEIHLQNMECMMEKFIKLIDKANIIQIRPKIDIDKITQDVLLAINSANSKYRFAEVNSIGLEPRTFRCLMNDCIMTVNQLIEKSEKELLNIPNFGKKSLKEVKGFLKRNGLHLTQKDD